MKLKTLAHLALLHAKNVPVIFLLEDFAMAAIITVLHCIMAKHIILNGHKKDYDKHTDLRRPK